MIRIMMHVDEKGITSGFEHLDTVPPEFATTLAKKAMELLNAHIQDAETLNWNALNKHDFSRDIWTEALRQDHSRN